MFHICKNYWQCKSARPNLSVFCQVRCTVTFCRERCLAGCYAVYADRLLLVQVCKQQYVTINFLIRVLELTK